MRPGRLVLALVAGLTLAGPGARLPGVAAPVHAQASPRVEIETNTREVEVGGRLELTMTVTVEGARVDLGEPMLAPPADFQVSRPSISFERRTRRQLGVTTQTAVQRSVFVLTPGRPGTFLIPSPVVLVGGRAVTGPPTRIEVVPASAVPPSLLDPFDPDPAATPPGPDLALATGPDDPVFLRAVADREQAVVGEPITVSYYLYFREAYEMTERAEPRSVDFLRHPLLTDPGSTTSTRTRVGGRVYGARLVDKVALVPLRTGKLPTGQLSARFNGRRIGARVLVKSNELAIEVREPPEDGRPAGYQLGDVGRFTLTATVEPRRVQQGGSIAVKLRVEGEGSLPSKLTLPDQKGVEWLAPGVHHAVSVRGGKLGGHRTFEHLVRLQRSGRVELGTVELPTWDPVARAYRVVRAELGAVEVEPVAPSPEDVARAAEGGARPEGPASLPAPRVTLGAGARTAGAPVPWRVLGAALIAPPALALGFIGLGFAGAAARRRRASGAGARRIQAAIREAKEAADRPDVRATAGAARRALDAALEARLGASARAIPRDRLPGHLAEAGLEAGLVADAIALVDACDEARFAPEADGGLAQDLARRAAELVARLSS